MLWVLWPLREQPISYVMVEVIAVKNSNKFGVSDLTLIVWPFQSVMMHCHLCGHLFGKNIDLFLSICILYSGKLSREKSFMNFEVLWLFAKIFSTKFQGVVSFGGSSKHAIYKCFLRKHLWKFPAIRYMEVKANWHECWWSQFHQLFDLLFFTSHHQIFFDQRMKIDCFSAFNLSRPLFLAKSTRPNNEDASLTRILFGILKHLEKKWFSLVSRTCSVYTVHPLSWQLHSCHTFTVCGETFGEEVSVS